MPWQQTISLERYRAFFNGIVTTGAETFLLLFAIQWFHADSSAKAFIAASVSTGLLLSPIALILSRQFHLTPSKASGYLWGTSAIFYLAATFAETDTGYLLGVSLALIFQNTASGLTTQIYHQNFPEDRRGRNYSQIVIIRMLSTIAWGTILGIFCNSHLESFSLILFLYAIASAYSALFLTRCQTKIIRNPHQERHLFRGLEYLRNDLLFRITLISWFMLGFANLMMNPLRVDYLANPTTGLAMPPSEVALYVTVIPSIARLVLTPGWGFLFDKLNFSTTRALVNVSFIFGIASFFLASSPLALIVGAIFYGIGLSGGDISWQLWVTKIAPADKSADYMAIHVLLTGLRGIIAPFFAFYLADAYSTQACAWLAMFLIVAANLILLGQRRGFAARR